MNRLLSFKKFISFLCAALISLGIAQSSKQEQHVGAEGYTAEQTADGYTQQADYGDGTELTGDYIPEQQLTDDGTTYDQATDDQQTGDQTDDGTGETDDSADEEEASGVDLTA